MSFKVIPIPSAVSAEVRQTLKSPQYKHPAWVDRARGYGPCRACLHTFDQTTDERILFTYNAFAGLSDLPLPSPIFIHKNECQTFADNNFPVDLRSLPMIFEAYDESGEMTRRENVSESQIENLIKRLFENNQVNYLHIRNAEAGCFIARIERT